MLLIGPPGAGKSDLLLRLLDRGWSLVADDQVALAERAGMLWASAPPALAGRLEVRGLGLLEGLPVTPEAALRLVIACRPAAEIPRLPEPATWSALTVTLPFVSLDPAAASAPERLAMAEAVASGRRRLTAGAIERDRPIPSSAAA